MDPTVVLFLTFLIGFVAGLRSLTAPAAVAWAALSGWLNLQSSPLAFMGSIATVIVFTVFALVELIADKLPKAPSRTKPIGLIARVVLGGLSGASVAVAGKQSLAVGACLGAIGGVVGAFAGYEARKRLVNALKIKDIFIAIPEDIIAIALAYFIVTRR